MYKVLKKQKEKSKKWKRKISKTGQGQKFMIRVLKDFKISPRKSAEKAYSE